MKHQQVICNITVHWNQLYGHYELLRCWQKEEFIHGIGVSINTAVSNTELLESIPHLVVHTIAGVATPETFLRLSDKNLNLLILGYKDYGRGIDYHARNKEVERKIRWVSDRVVELSDHFRSICFDNLSVHQLGLKEKMTETAWHQFYMGDDGEFTMYVDLVSEKYAASSVSKRKGIFADDIRKLFKA